LALQIVKSLQRQNHFVAITGDGANGIKDVALAFESPEGDELEQK